MSAPNYNMEFKLKIEQIKELPTLPGVAKSLLKLQKNPDATIQQLANIIEFDPILSTQILKYSNSAFFNSARQIDSLSSAINLIGFNNALNFSLGISSANQFQVPMSGTIGMRGFWQHAIYSAHLMQLLANKIPLENPPLPGIAYLAGLLHNFGFILLGHSFPMEFDELNQALSRNDADNVLTIERALLGVHHYELAVWLMRKWGLQKEIMASVFEHHNESYRGANWVYANLALINDRVLFNYGLGDADSGELPDRILKALEINEEIVEECAEALFSQKESIDIMIDGMLSSTSVNRTTN